MLGKIVLQPTKVILPIDPAIRENTEAQYEAYRAAGYDESVLKIDPLNPPTRFLLRQLTDEQRDGCTMMSSQSIMRGVSMRIRCGMVGMDNYKIRKADGTVVDAGKPDTENAGVMGTIITEKWLSDLSMPDAHKIALANEIREFSEATLPLSVPSGPPSGDSADTGKESAP